MGRARAWEVGSPAGLGPSAHSPLRHSLRAVGAAVVLSLLGALGRSVPQAETRAAERTVRGGDLAAGERWRLTWGNRAASPPRSGLWLWRGGRSAGLIPRCAGPDGVVPSTPNRRHSVGALNRL